MFGRVIAAIVAAAVKEEDFALACVRARAWAADLARLRVRKFCRCANEVSERLNHINVRFNDGALINVRTPNKIMFVEQGDTLQQAPMP